MVKILDCTLRDGGHMTNWEFDDGFVKALLACQNNSGVTYCEIGYRNRLENENKGRFYNCTPEFIKKFYDCKNTVHIGVMTDAKRFNSEDFPGVDNDYLDFVRVAGRPYEIEKILETALILHKKGYKIFVQLMDVSNIDEMGYITLFDWQYKDILESLYFADSFGKLYSDDVEKYYNKFKILGYKNISFHAHNNIHTALENTLKAVDLGAYSVDVTSSGIGRFGGNLNATALLECLEGFTSKYYQDLNK